ncbi:MAG TPA: aminotransferase class V-fold PLP-dependent enzyme [Pelomicrobium sp.]|nr:aminotransferase class V-fold PLP-dependent enzyme [Pelomicrobium sp.]
MSDEPPADPAARALERAAAYGLHFRAAGRPLHPSAGAPVLRRLFDVGLSDAGRDPAAVLEDLIRAVEPGLVGNTDPRFFAWVMGSSHPAGVAADWLTSIWGQNAGIFQTSPAAAIAEEITAGWLLDLLDLPRESSVGFTTGATMAAFICLAAARGEVLRRAGHDFDENGLQGAPSVTVLIGEDAHASNFAALRYLGFGARNLRRLPADGEGALEVAALADALAASPGPTIVVCQAGQINTGAFDRFEEIARLAAARGAWLHVDGAFGLWARAVAELKPLTQGVKRADSWAVDGHKWLQIPYDSGFAIVRDAHAHRRAMDISASYLSESPGDGRNPTHYNPELSRRARVFAAWTMIQVLGRQGIAELVRRHCACAAAIAARCRAIDGVEVLNGVCLNQVILGFTGKESGEGNDALTERVAQALNDSGRFFLRTADWKGRRVLRVSVIANGTDRNVAEELADAIESAWRAIRA